MRKFAVVLSLVIIAQVAFAETTVELLQKRAEDGDATAQTLIGNMYFYGYHFDRDYDQAEKWYERAVKNGDAFAGERLRVVQRMPKDRRKTIKSMSRGNISNDDSIAKASVAEFAGNVGVEDLLLHRDEYVGKVVRLKFSRGDLFSGRSAPDTMTVWDSGGDVTVRMQLPDDIDAREWGLDCDKGDTGGSVYVFVEKAQAYAQGTRRRKTEEGYTYSW